MSCGHCESRQRLNFRWKWNSERQREWESERANIFNARINLLKRNLQSSSLTDFIEPRVCVRCVCISICKMRKSITIKNVFRNFAPNMFGEKFWHFKIRIKNVRSCFICYILRSVNTSCLCSIRIFGGFVFVEGLATYVNIWNISNMRYICELYCY